jgi:transposase-like protein
MARKKGSKDYPLEMRQEAVRLFYEEGLTRAQITQQLELRDPKRVKNWLRRYRREGAAFFLSRRHRSGRRPKRENTEAYIARLEMEIELLKKYHTELRQAMLAKRNIGPSNTTEGSTQ